MKIFGWTIGRAKKDYDRMDQYFGSSRVSGGDNLKVTDQELFAGWVYACVRAIADQVAQLDWMLHQKVKGDDRTIEEHPALDLLDRVNPFFTRYTLLERLQSNLELHGNEYWYLIKNGKGIPVEIIPLNPTCMKVIRPEERTNNTYVLHYEYMVMNKVEIIPPENIIHFKNFNPFSDIVGMSTIEPARLLVETDFFTKEYNRRFFQNDATPNVVLTHPDSLLEPAQQRILDKWNDKFSGFRKAHKTALLHGGMDIRVIGNHADMQFIEQSRMTRDDILAMFGVPKTILGVTEDVTVSNAQASNYIFSLRTIQPKMHRIIDTINEFYLPLFGDPSLYFEYKSPVKEDEVALTTANATKFNNGQLTINEWRKQDGLPPVEGGDLVFLPFSLTAYGRPIEQKKIEPAQGKSSVLTLFDNVREVLAKKKEFEAPLNQSSTTPIAIDQVSANRSQLVSMDMESFEALGKKVSAMQRVREEPYIKKTKEIVEGIFEKQRKEVVKNLPDLVKNKGKKNTKAKVPFPIDNDAWVKTTIELMTPVMRDLFEKEGKNAYKNLGLNPDDFTLSTPSAQDFLRKNAKKFAGEITQTTSDAVRKEIADGLDEGLGIAELTDILTDFEDFSPFSKGRAEMIALTETHRTASESELQAWDESGVVMKKIWYTALDERVCEECSMLHGTEIPLDEPFVTVAELQKMGYSNYDGDVEITQLHPRCRCTAIPVIED